MIDSHQHFWHYTPSGHPWIDDTMAVLQRDFLPADLEREMDAHGIHGSVAVQAPQSLDETRYLLGLADDNPRILGVVGWVDLCSPEVAAQLEEFAAHPRFVGVRHIVQSESNDRFVLRDDFLRGIAALSTHGLTYDILVFPHQLPAVLELVERFPQQPFVLDHIAKPYIARGDVEPWAQHIRTLAGNPGMMCKLSGMVTEADWRSWKPEQFRPYLDTVLEAFGADRLMFGSDWPVCTLAATYGQVLDLVRDHLSELPKEQQRAVFSENAARFYGLHAPA